MQFKLNKLACILLLFVCCPLSVVAKNNSAETITDLLIGEDWLRQHMDDKSLVIIDARSRKDYLQGHIKGAVSLPSWDTYSDRIKRDRLAPANEIKETFGVAGIDGDTRVIVYDYGEFRLAARVLWSLHAYGHENVSLLSVGFDAWKSKSLPTSSDETIRKRKYFIPVVKPERLATSFQTMLATKNKKVAIVDVRTPDEYRGETSGSSRYGHIPSAVNIDWRDLVIKDGKYKQLKTTDKLRDLFKDVPEDNHVITYCQKGHEASLAYFVLRLLGREVSVYDGSWFEWGNSNTHPIEGPDIAPLSSKQ